MTDLQTTDPYVTVPPIDPDRRAIECPVVEVTLLEDRARVVRRGTITIEAGRARRMVEDIAPVAHDVSLQISATGAAVADGRIRRAHRILPTHTPADLQALEARIEAALVEHARLAGAVERAEDEGERLANLLERSLAELPVDVSWGLHDAATWRATIGRMLERLEATHGAALTHWFAAQDVRRALSHDIDRRVAANRPDVQLVARVELDLDATAAGEVELEIAYTVPNALWRPAHTITLDDGLHVATRAAVWQFTGEDWRDATLRFSTARGSLGTEPPLLDDDLLAAERRDDAVRVEMREVEIQRTGTEQPASATVELPGVDDGGEVRVLSAASPETIVSNGRAHFVPLGETTLSADVELIATPELLEAFFLEARTTWTGDGPLLAGPVDLVRGGGQVGTTSVPFTAPGQPLTVSFGAVDDLRIVRDATREITRPNRYDTHTHAEHTITHHVSNLADKARMVTIVERVPIAEVPGVRVSAPEAPDPDEFGMRYDVFRIGPRAQMVRTQEWCLSAAPTVTGVID